MISTIALMLPHPRRAVMVVLGLGAVAGCSIFAASGQSAAKIERPVQEQVTSLQARQTQLLTERDQPQTTAPDITQPRQQPGFAQDEMARLAQDRTQILPRSPAARPPLAAASSAGSSASEPSVSDRLGCPPSCSSASGASTPHSNSAEKAWTTPACRRSW